MINREVTDLLVITCVATALTTFIFGADENFGSLGVIGIGLGFVLVGSFTHILTRQMELATPEVSKIFAWVTVIILLIFVKINESFY